MNASRKLLEGAGVVVMPDVATVIVGLVAGVGAVGVATEGVV